ncbi:MAG: hypothetical protein IKX60_01465 [Bacteroidales bacterium]|nr:hypothetical protein [Bacteroidales bacterium]
MKKAFIVLCAAILVCSCTDDKAEQAAEGFLSSYFQMDYDSAVAYCDSTVARNLRIASDNWQALDTTLLGMIKEAAANTRYEITSVDKESEKDKAFVKYLLYPMDSDKGQEMSMTLVKKGGKWLISSLE